MTSWRACVLSLHHTQHHQNHSSPEPASSQSSSLRSLPLHQHHHSHQEVPAASPPAGPAASLPRASAASPASLAPPSAGLRPRYWTRCGGRRRGKGSWQRLRKRMGTRESRAVPSWDSQCAMIGPLRFGHDLKTNGTTVSVYIAEGGWDVMGSQLISDLQVP